MHQVLLSRIFSLFMIKFIFLAQTCTMIYRSVKRLFFHARYRSPYYSFISLWNLFLANIVTTDAVVIPRCSHQSSPSDFSTQRRGTSGGCSNGTGCDTASAEACRGAGHVKTTDSCMSHKLMDKFTRNPYDWWLKEEFPIDLPINQLGEYAFFTGHFMAAFETNSVDVM